MAVIVMLEQHLVTEKLPPFQEEVLIWKKLGHNVYMDVAARYGSEEGWCWGVNGAPFPGVVLAWAKQPVNQGGS